MLKRGIPGYLHCVTSFLSVCGVLAVKLPYYLEVNVSKAFFPRQLSMGLILVPFFFFALDKDITMRLIRTFYYAINENERW
jgi:hypothetical protein